MTDGRKETTDTGAQGVSAVREGFATACYVQGHDPVRLALCRTYGHERPVHSGCGHLSSLRQVMIPCTCWGRKGSTYAIPFVKAVGRFQHGTRHHLVELNCTFFSLGGTLVCLLRSLHTAAEMAEIVSDRYDRRPVESL